MNAVAWSPPRPLTAASQPREVSLTVMQASVLTSLCEGKDNAAIGADWGIRIDTTKAHMKAVLRALGARDRVHAAVLAMSGEVQIVVRPAPLRGAAGIAAVKVREDGTLGRAGFYRPAP